MKKRTNFEKERQLRDYEMSLEQLDVHSAVQKKETKFKFKVNEVRNLRKLTAP